MSKLNRLIEAVCKSPLLWGAIASAGFFGAVQANLLGDEFFQRYCAGHPVEYVETILFFVGLAVLAVKAIENAGQRRRVAADILGPVPPGGQDVSECEALLAQLEAVARSRPNDYLVRRLRDGIEYVWRRGSGESLDEHLKHLADLDADRAQGRSGLLRLIVWAIPILGFLGTVIGITMAIANLKIDALESSMIDVTSGLGVAFDTTALALSLVTILMFINYYVERAEGDLLEEVNRRADAELLSRFPKISATPDGQTVAFRKMADTMVHSLEQIVRRQAELWKASLESARERWTQLSDASGRQLQAALSESLKAHAHQVAVVEDSAAEKNRRHWAEVQQSLARASETLAGVQGALVQKAEILGKAVESTSYVAKLEETLNKNLAALAGAKNFEETVVSLAAAINLLTTRLSTPATPAPAVRLENHRRTGQAA